jgi:hypothetical protein
MHFVFILPRADSTLFRVLRQGPRIHAVMGGLIASFGGHGLQDSRTILPTASAR